MTGDTGAIRFLKALGLVVLGLPYCQTQASSDACRGPDHAIRAIRLCHNRHRHYGGV